MKMIEIWNPLQVLFFREGLNREMINMTSSIEFAFDQYRGNLLTMMKSFDEFLERTEKMDELTHCIFAETHSKIQQIATNYPIYWEHNELTFRNLLLPSELNLIYTILPPPDEHTQEHPSQKIEKVEISKNEERKREISSYNSIIQLIVHINRDWSPIGNAVREKLYFQKIIPKVQEYLPKAKDSDSIPLILIPGAGSGRLALELASLEYRIEANECSATMVCFMNNVFNNLLPKRKLFSFYPYLHHHFQDDWNLDIRSQAFPFPFIDDSPSLSSLYSKENEDLSINSNGSLTIQYGDFVRLYGMNDDHAKFYDGIITNFFIDTSTNIFDYLFTIQKILKPGGIWINLGPLHYHHKQAIPYSYQHLLEIIQSMHFDLLFTEVVENSYYGEEMVMMKPEYYRIPFNVFRYTPPGPTTPLQEKKSCPPTEERQKKEESFQRPDYVVIN